VLAVFRNRDPVLFWPLDPGWKKIRILDHFSGSLQTVLFGLKIIKFFDADLDPGSGMEKIQIRDPA
jgi:hypothetical protein